MAAKRAKKTPSTLVNRARETANKTAKPAKDASQPASASTKKLEVKITAAKGRPMLTWVGKRPLTQVTAFPAQLVERHDAINILGMQYVGGDVDTESRRMEVFRGLRPHWNRGCWEGQPGLAVPESGGLLFHGDNKEVLAHLLADGYRGKVDLIYIDPPFDSGADYVRMVNLRGAKGGVKLDGESYTLGEQVQYTDIWANDNYLQFMYERLLLLKELLSDAGTLYLHCDQRKSHHFRCVMDEVLGPASFVNEITRVKCNPKNFEQEAFGNIHDTVLSYRKTDKAMWNHLLEELDSEDVARLFPQVSADRRRYTTVALHAPGTRNGDTGRAWKGLPPAPGRHWAYLPDELDRLDKAGLIEWSSKGNPRQILWADEQGNRRVQDIWTMKDPTYPIYPTEKNADLLRRIILASSEPGSLVLDCFCGAGTTALLAQELGRRWIACDINKGAIQTTTRQLRSLLTDQISQALADRKEQAGKLSGMSNAEASDRPKPCQFGFNVWRVNDYDLQIQHNEAVNLACEHIGIQRTRTDNYFDGTLGRNLVKIVPFGHPLTPLDLEELRRELDARPDEDRGVTLVCLGMELAAKSWIDDWNRLRKGRGAVNRIDVIELRTDPKYGKFIEHRPAKAKVKIARKDGRIAVEIEDFISPTIIERLTAHAGVLQPKIDDWRAMVDCVMIDTAYGGNAFNVVLADVPEKKTDFVSGLYDLPAPDGETTVAVRITDMLGEEFLITEVV